MNLIIKDIIILIVTFLTAFTLVDYDPMLKDNLAGTAIGFTIFFIVIFVLIHIIIDLVIK